MSGWELALGNRILHSAADQTEAPGWGCWCPSQGGIWAPGPSQVIFPSSLPHLISPRPPAASATSASAALVKMPGPFSFVQQDSVAQPSAHMRPCRHPHVGVLWLQQRQLRRVWDGQTSLEDFGYRPSCETVGKSLLSGPLLPCWGGGDNEARVRHVKWIIVYCILIIFYILHIR